MIKISWLWIMFWLLISATIVSWMMDRGEPAEMPYLDNMVVKGAYLCSPFKSGKWTCVYLVKKEGERHFYIAVLDEKQELLKFIQFDKESGEQEILWQKQDRKKENLPSQLRFLNEAKVIRAGWCSHKLTKEQAICVNFQDESYQYLAVFDSQDGRLKEAYKKDADGEVIRLYPLKGVEI